MKSIQQRILYHQARFTDHPFFARLEADPPLDQLAPFPLCLTFFVVTFQEILRISDERASDPEYKAMVHRHRIEDAGHDRWFFADLSALGIAPPTAAELLSRPIHRAARRASFALASEAFGARHDACQLTLLLTLESAGHVFFERFARYLARIGERRRLRYFSQKHLDVERAHDVFEEGAGARIEAIPLDEEARREASALVDRCYREMTAMFDAFEAQIAASAGRSWLTARRSRGSSTAPPPRQPPRRGRPGRRRSPRSTPATPV